MSNPYVNNWSCQQVPPTCLMRKLPLALFCICLISGVNTSVQTSFLHERPGRGLIVWKGYDPQPTVNSPQPPQPPHPKTHVPRTPPCPAAPPTPNQLTPHTPPSGNQVDGSPLSQCGAYVNRCALVNSKGYVVGPVALQPQPTCTLCSPSDPSAPQRLGYAIARTSAKRT